MAQAAAVAGVTRSGLRSVLARARAAGVELEAPRAAWPDARTPLVDAAALDAYLAGRPRGRKISRELQSRAVPAPAARPEDFPTVADHEACSSLCPHDRPGELRCHCKCPDCSSDGADCRCDLCKLNRPSECSDPNGGPGGA